MNIIRPPTVVSGIVSLDEMLRRQKALQRERQVSRRRKPVASPVPSGCGLVRDGVDYVFESLEIAPDRYAHVALGKLLPEKRSQSEWWSYVQSTPGATIANGVILYQMMYRLYTLRKDPSMKGVCAGALRVLRKDFVNSYPYLGTRIDYVPGSLAATIQHLQPDKTISSISLIIPEFTLPALYPNWSYIVLANERLKSELGKSERLPPVALLFLRGLLGAHAEEAGAVCQYVSPRNGNNLREVQLWVPSAQGRKPRTLRFGVYDSGFGIGANDDVNSDGSVRGVVVRETFPGGAR